MYFLSQLGDQQQRKTYIILEFLLSELSTKSQVSSTQFMTVFPLCCGLIIQLNKEFLRLTMAQLLLKYILFK